MPIIDEPNQHAHTIGQRAESRVLNALSSLPAPWQFFSTVEWRLLQRDGESIGEADVVVFHPTHGLVVFEIKAGEVEVRNGSWYYGSGLPMKQSPMAQARRNRYALQEKLRQRLGAGADTLMVTHAIWFPEITWKAAAPMEIPSRHFLLDRNALKDPESALLALLREAAPNGPAWSRSQQQALKELLAPDCHLLVPLSVQLDATLDKLHQATEQQMSVLRMLRSQLRLLVEGGAGYSPACWREHAAQGKSVLLTCFNKQLANHLAACLADCHNVQVTNFHELVHQSTRRWTLPQPGGLHCPHWAGTIFLGTVFSTGSRLFISMAALWKPLLLPHQCNWKPICGTRSRLVSLPLILPTIHRQPHSGYKAEPGRSPCALQIST